MTTSFQGSQETGCLRHSVSVKSWTDSQSVALSDDVWRCDLRCNPSNISYENDLDHWNSCQEAQTCPRCKFEKCFFGMVRKGQIAAYSCRDELAWRSKFVFVHPALGERTWLCPKPYSFGGPWAIGCWPCMVFGGKFSSSFSRAEVNCTNMIQITNMKLHETGKGHRAALAEMSRQFQPLGADVSGPTYNNDIPRIEKFHLAGTIVSTHDSFSDFGVYCRSLAVSSALATSLSTSIGDFSARICKQLVSSLAAPLRAQDQLIMKFAFWHEGVGVQMFKSSQTSRIGLGILN